MPSQMEYHVCVRHPIPSSVALLGAVVLILASTTLAQNNGAQGPGTAVGSVHSATGSVIPHTGAVIPPTGSVRPPTGTAPNVNFSGTVPNSRVTFSGSPASRDNGDRHRHHHSRGGYTFPFVYAYPVPYAVDYGGADDSADSDSADDEADDQGGPTVFDRRGSGADSYVPPVADSALMDEASRNDTASGPDRPQPPTLLVFKDGRTVELGNYAIIGATLFDLTPGHTRKVALSDLDLAATQRQNDDRGVSFALPAPPQAN